MATSNKAKLYKSNEKKTIQAWILKSQIYSPLYISLELNRIKPANTTIKNICQHYYSEFSSGDTLDGGGDLFQIRYVITGYVGPLHFLIERGRFLKNDASPSCLGHRFRNLGSLKNIIKKKLFFGF